MVTDSRHVRTTTGANTAHVISGLDTTVVDATHDSPQA
jgi:hypothetical protein